MRNNLLGRGSARQWVSEIAKIIIVDQTSQKNHFYQKLDISSKSTFYNSIIL